jgi:hypothetical protein
VDIRVLTLEDLAALLTWRERYGINEALRASMMVSGNVGSKKGSVSVRSIEASFDDPQSLDYSALLVLAL